MNTIAIPGFADPVSALSHLGGLAAVVVLAPFLVARGAGHPGRVAALGVYAFTVAFLLAMSGVYHLLAAASPGRAVLRVLDHAAVFALIAGTFTPVHAIVFRGLWRWGMLAVVWGLAFAAIALKSVFFGAVPEWLGLSLYLALGWIGLASGIALGMRFGLRFIAPLIAGAAAYTAGAAIDFAGVPTVWPGVIGPHELFHAAVLAGIASHWRFVARIAHGGTVRAPSPAATAPALGPYNADRSPRRQAP